jgi:hypothetical protein
VSELDRIAGELARARSTLERALDGARSWDDDQRRRLDRARIDPLIRAAVDYDIAVGQAISMVDQADRMLRD